MMNEKKIVLVGVVVLSVFMNVALVAQVWAAGKYNCKELDPGMGGNPTLNPSLSYACRKQRTEGGEWGAMWLSDNDIYNDTSNTININAQDFRNKNGIKNIYLRGAVVGGGDADATYIKLVKYDENFFGVVPDGFSNYSAFVTVPSSITRLGNGYNDLTIWSTAVPIELKTRTLVANEYRDVDCSNSNMTKGCCNSNMATSCTITLQAFRCYQGEEPYEGNSSCFSDDSDLQVNIDHSFQGKIRILKSGDINIDYDNQVPDSDKVDSGWSGSEGFNNNISYEIKDCGITCWAQFRHYLWSDSGYSATKYSIKRDVLGAGKAQPAVWSEVSTGEFNGNNNKVPLKDAVEMSPGQTVCETLTFYSEKNKQKAIKACVTAKAKDPLGGMTIAMNTDNTEIGLGDWQKESEEDDDKWWEATNGYEWTRVGNDPTEVLKYINCSVVDGCFVQFRHYLQNQKGSGSSAYYKIERSTNSGVSCILNNILNNDNPCNGIVKAHSEIVFEKNTGTGLQSDIVKIYPGQKVCETLYFKENQSDSYNTYTKACVTALGAAASNIDVKVENKTLKTGLEKSVYAKPDDEVTYMMTYDPTLQYTNNLVVDKANVSINGVAGTSKNKDNDLKTLFEELTTYSWNNAFRASGVYNGPYIYGVGVRGQKNEPKDWKVVDTETREYVQTATINPTDKDDNVWATPTSVSFSSNEGLFAQLKVETIAASAAVYVPYNFINSVSIDAESVKGEMYAGGSGSVSYTPKVNPKQNNKTKGTYATMVKNPKVRVCVHLSGESECLNDDSYPQKPIGKAVWNESSNANGSTETPKTINFKVPDYPAGTLMCVDVSVYPANSGADTNWSDAEGSHTWSEPAEKCFTIAKSPSFQVWGGSVSANTIDAKAIKKTTINGHSGEVRTFGSWAELAITSNSNDDMASGAGFGYGEPGLVVDTDPGGNSDGEYGDLTFSGGGSEAIDLGKMKASLEKDGYNAEGGNKMLYYIDGTYTISDNIEREDTYDSLESIPSIVILAKNIDIECDVDRIDAILIAKDNINTCSDGGTLQTSKVAQNQLIINGAIKTGGKLSLNRTYGAATGNNSIVPAEIINYDNSMMFIGGGSASASASVDPSKLEVQHIRELAPRY